MKKIIPLVLLITVMWAPLLAQTQVTGKVADVKGNALPGVNVFVRGTTLGTITDAAGTYTIALPDGQSVLGYSFIGYLTQEIEVQGRTSLDVALEEDLQKLDEVIVVGYGTQRKSDLTGAVSSVSSAELKATPVTSFDQALQGRAAGVQVVQASGAPGGGVNIRIRGTSSVNASSEPLYVIDGMLINTNSDEVNIGGRGPAINPLASINPSDIESIEILKDASATAIYGSRAANGVVLITTKRGKSGKANVSFETYYSEQQVTHQLPVLNGTQFAELVNDAAANAGKPAVYANPQSYGKGTDWQKELFRTAPIANYQLSINGGNDKTQYAISGGYYKQTGIVTGSALGRYSFRSNFDTQISKKFKVGMNLTYNRMITDGVSSGPGVIIQGVVYDALIFDPTQPVYDASVPGGYTFESDRRDAISNPVAEAREYLARTTTSRMMSTIFGEFEIIPGLKLRSSFGIDDIETKSNTFAPNFLKQTQNSHGEASISTLTGLTWLNTNTLTYTRQINQHHNFTALAGYETQKFRNETVQASAFGFPEARTGWHNIGAAENPQTTQNGELGWSIMSFFGRLNYTYNNKYLLTVTGRTDGSSKFAAGNKYGFFPSAAFAWKVIDEDFMKGQTFLDDLKFRIGYGRTGNQSIPPYQSLALIKQIGQGVFSNGTTETAIRGYEPNSYPNKALRWESTGQWNVGVDFAILKGRVSGSLDLYSKKTKDLLLNTPIPYTSGFETTLLNIGNVQNKGIDLSLNSVNIDGPIRWTTGFVFSIVRNKITNLARKGDVNLNVGGNILREGQPIGTFYGYKFDGIYQSDAEADASPHITGQTPKAGDRRYADISGPNGTPDGVVDDFDRTIIGHAQPDFIYGLNNTITYKGFTLSFFFQGSQGNQLVNLNLNDLANVNGLQNVLAKPGLQRWTPEHPNNKYARALAGGNDNVFSSRFVEDASYLRLKNVTIGYNLPTALLQRVKLASARLYVSGTNLWTLTNYSGFDPEGNGYSNTTNIVGVDYGTYPQARTYTVGVNFGF